MQYLFMSPRLSTSQSNKEESGKQITGNTRAQVL